MKRATSFRLSDEALRLLAKLAKKQGISQSAWLEIVIREAAQKQRVERTV
jgi:predicted DNA-binding protein